MGGKSSAAAPTRYAGIQVQTSALGVQIPIVWGTARCKCNLVWYGDFKSKAQKASTGKGGGTTTGYSYSASLVLGVCEGPIADVTSVWVDSKQYVGGNGHALRQAGLSMSTGDIGQAPWGYLTSKFPGQAIGYSGLCIVYASNYPLGGSAATPNHAFEVVSTTRLSALNLPDANPKDIVTDFFLNSRYGLPSWQAGLLDQASLQDWGNYCLAANLVLSPVLDQAQTGSAFLTELFLATNSTCVWSEGVLKFIPYGDTEITGNGVTWTPNLTPVYSLDGRNFIPQADGDDPLMVELQDQSDAYNIVQIEYLDRSNQYNTAIATAQDLANIDQYGRRKKSPTTVHSICSPAVAQIAAQLHLQRTLYVRAQYRFDLDWSFALLEPGDIVEITDPGAGLNAYPVRITQIDDDEHGRRSVTAEDLLTGVSHAPLYNNQEGLGYVSNRAIDPGGVEANLLLWSEDLTNVAWSHNATTVTANAATDPLFGTTTADAVIPTTANASHAVSQGVTVFGGVPYCLVGYAKPDGYTSAFLQVFDGSGDGVAAVFDLNAGAVLSSSAGGSAQLVSTSIVSAGGGWYRIAVIGVLPNTGAAGAYCGVGAGPFAGNGASGVYFWGLQFKQGQDVPQYVATASAIAGPFLFNPPVSLATGPQSEAAAAVAGGVYWGGCNIWLSADGTNYQQVGQIDQPARFGLLKSSLPSHADPDTTDSFTVDLGGCMGVLSGGSSADADAASTLCLVDNELIAYETATLSAQGRYTLGTYLRRGLMGTSIGSHSSGAAFIRLDEGVFYFPYIAQQSGKQVYVKFQSFNTWGEAVQDLSVCNAYLITLNPEGTAAGITGGGNRICFSDFDHGPDDGWSTGYNSAGLSLTRGDGTLQGVPYNAITATSTASGQTISQKSIPFPVTGGERLAVECGLQAGAGWTCNMAIGFLDSTGATISEPSVGPTLTSPAFNTPAAGFVSVPANAVSAWLEIYATSTTSGAQSYFAISRPMVVGAAAEQTTFPAYVKGPAAEYGADITGDWTAAGIAGQAPAATDGTIQAGATYNEVFDQASDPAASGPVNDGAFWYNSSSGVFYTRTGGAWKAIGGQISDGALLFSTANFAHSEATWSYTIPANAPGYVTVTIGGGDGGYTTNYIGGVGGQSIKHFAVTPGTTVLSGYVGGNGVSVNDNGQGTPSGGYQSTCVCSTNGSISMYANGGGAASNSANGTPGTAGGGDTNTTGGGGSKIQIVAHTS